MKLVITIEIPDTADVQAIYEKPPTDIHALPQAPTVPAPVSALPPFPAPQTAPQCPVHNWAMKPSRKGGGWYCSGKMDDGSYCQERAS